MNWQSQPWRVFLRLAGVLLVLAGSLVAYGWFYKLGPARHTLDPDWRSRHSQQEYWQEVQDGIHRGMWFHDDGFTVGWFGDKSWAEWIMSHVKPGASMGCLGGDPCHSATAMRFITNQDAGQDADAWFDWWEKNKSKSQEKWIADGFAQRGLKIDMPPKPEQASIILKLLGDPETNETTATPNHVKYNAFRSLRDSGFDPVGFSLSNRTISADIERGLLEYAKWQRRYPEAIGLGILSFGKTAEDRVDWWVPELLTPKVQITAYTLVFAPIVFGVLLLIWSFWERKQGCSGSSTNATADFANG